MLKIAVLVSGGGSNLQAIIDAIAAKNLKAEISVVIADRDCYGLERARVNKINAVLVDRKLHKLDLSKQLDMQIPCDCALIVLAGFLSILDSKFIQRWSGKIINIHPSLLPKFGGAGMWGMNVHRAVIDAGEKKSGCTVHYVTEEIDGGNIIEQSVIEVSPNDSSETLQKKVLELEHPTLIKAIKKFTKEVA